MKTDNLQIDEQFKSLYNLMKEKIQEIASLPHSDGDMGDTFEGIDLLDDSIRYISSYYSYGQYNECNFYVKWEDINKPLDFFKEKFENDFNNKQKRLLENKEKELREKEEREIQLLKELKEKYKNQIGL
jgi:predicted ribosome quality control (RQC) complex YloA/Tae2 family protein